ncbi:MAG: hypothetical protein ACFFGZ_16730 [Candidatus Thorarchaeota archaeon]
MPNVVTIVTGPKVGLQSTWFLEDTVAFAAQLGKKIVVFDLFEEILKQSNINPQNAYERALYIGELLDGYQYQFKLMREKAYLSIARQMDKLPKNTNVIIRTPASIEWRGFNLEFKDHLVIAKELNPDRIITLIDAEWKIMERLKSEYGSHVLRVIAHQKEMTLEKILDWLASEVSRSEDWAEWATYLTGKKVRHFVLGIGTPSREDRGKYVRDVDNMAKFATEKELPTFYASYSMTVATEEIRKEINELIWRLRDYGAVIDPASIEIGHNINQKDESVVFAYTVCRDLRWDVEKVDIVAAFHPYKEMPPLSTGMLDELGHARAFRKERYLVMPVGAGSPFTRDNYVPANHLFKDGESFFRFIEKRRRPILKPRFIENTKMFDKWQKERLSKKP